MKPFINGSLDSDCKLYHMENHPQNFPLRKELLVSVIISTYNRCAALPLTLQALGEQTIPSSQYEVLVVDDGSTDDTSQVLEQVAFSCSLRTFRQPENRGVSAGRNVAIHQARGRYLIFLSDDMIVPENFIATHVATLEQFPGYWIVGGIQQIDSTTETPFGRYLDRQERVFEEARKAKPIGYNLWEMSWPTARNLSLPRADLERTGLFDEQFRISCEDQDLAHRAMDVGVRFLYNANITCLHNDQVATLERACRQQQQFAHDGALFCAKRPHIHGDAELVRLNGYLSWHDKPRLIAKKLIKQLIATRLATALIESTVHLAERARVPEPLLYRMYRLVIGLYIFRGWRHGLQTLKRREADLNA